MLDQFFTTSTIRFLIIFCSRCKGTAFFRLLLVNNYHFSKLAAKVLLFFSSRCLIIGTNFHSRIVLFIPLLFFLPLLFVHCFEYYSVISLSLEYKNNLLVGDTNAVCIHLSPAKRYSP